VEILTFLCYTNENEGGLYYVARGIFSANGKTTAGGISGILGSIGAAQSGSVAIESVEGQCAAIAFCARAGALGTSGILL
jgi:hypothetical protein